MARRVLALAFLGLALAVCVVLAASESLTNRTGRTATAVTVTFSEQVRITSYDESVFPTKEPSSRSETFRFSGGQLENGARFSVSWTPSSAEITSTEWETTDAASSGSTASNAPLTYDQIMAQIAHYPGPDEPLYVPAEGEQIWLTDLEGHADIYDNDSIKINYAPDFDKSQITRINAYRNGVYMRFLPTLFDVLTNEQMKTFDGNPAENSPAGKHTDHAIMGYTYALRFYEASSSSPTVALIAHIKSGATWRPKYVYAYLLGNWNETILDYDRAAIVAWMAKLKAGGFTGLSLDYNLYVDALDANEVVAQYGPPPNVWYCPPQTATLEQYEAAITSAEQAGLEVEFRVHIYLSTYWWETHRGQWSFTGGLDPADPTAFLDSLFVHIRPILELCERHQVERADLLTEMSMLETHTGPIKAFLDKVAGVFNGELGIETVPPSMFDTGHGYSLFWDWTSGNRRLTVNGSSWTPTLETQNDQRYSIMVTNFVSYNLPFVQHFAAKYPDLSFCWGELGTYPVDGVARGVEYFYGSRPDALDLQEFNDALAAALIGSAALDVKGACIWFFVPFDSYALKTENSFISTSSSTMGLISSIIGP